MMTMANELTATAQKALQTIRNLRKLARETGTATTKTQTTSCDRCRAPISLASPMN
jgi:hypothetical protein